MLQSTQSYHVTCAEGTLIDAIVSTKFGDIMDVSIEDQPISGQRLLTEKQIALLEFIRQGNPFIDKVVVHEGDPMQVEIRTVIGGFKCTRKIRM